MSTLDTRESSRTASLATLAMLSIVAFWGLSFVSTKSILNSGFPPMTLVFLRFVLASAILLPLQRRLHPGARIERGSRGAVILSGLFGVSIYFVLETTGIRLTSASSAALIIASIPVFMAVADFLFYRTPILKRQVAGILLSVLGVYLIANRSPEGRQPQALLGNLLMLGACLSWVAYILFSKRVSARLPRLTLTAWQSFWGAVFLLPLALLEHRDWTAAAPLVWINLLYLGLFCSALSYYLYMYTLDHLGPVVVTSWLNLIPLIGAIGGVLILGERLSPLQMAGGGVIIAGVFIVSWKRS